MVHAGYSLDGVVINTNDDEIFENTSADITQDLLVQVGAFPASRYQATSSAGQFGSVGLSTAVVDRGARVSAQVIIESDEFVNVTGVPQRAAANFVIDGGSLFIDFGRSVLASYELELEVWNLGNVPMENDRNDFNFVEHNAPGFPYLDGHFYTEGVLERNAAGAASFVSIGQDIGAVFDPQRGRVEIPLSFQTLDLDTLNPGDRLFLSYTLTLITEVTVATEGAFSRFSDPLNLSGTPVLPTITLTPIPEPSSVLLLIASLATICGFRRLSRQRVEPEGWVPLAMPVRSAS
jgi:hypothetical protein